MRQILYVSRNNAAVGEADLDGIVEKSRHNNALEGVSGLLWSDGARFLQILEGPDESVAAAFERIVADSRHRDVEVLLDRTVEAREFGGWTMARRTRWDTADRFDEKMRRDLSRTSPQIRAAFLDLLPES